MSVNNGEIVTTKSDVTLSELTQEPQEQVSQDNSISLEKTIRFFERRNLNYAIHVMRNIDSTLNLAIDSFAVISLLNAMRSIARPDRVLIA